MPRTDGHGSNRNDRSPTTARARGLGAIIQIFLCTFTQHVHQPNIHSAQVCYLQKKRWACAVITSDWPILITGIVCPAISPTDTQQSRILVVITLCKRVQPCHYHVSSLVATPSSGPSFPHWSLWAAPNLVCAQDSFDMCSSTILQFRRPSVACRASSRELSVPGFPQWGM
jgi:hypothetical protein